ncbi:hypothetical protein ACE6H2_020231 [Prunus campanulata]
MPTTYKMWAMNLKSLVEQGIAFNEDRRWRLNILDKFVQDQAYAYAYQKQQDKEAQEQKIMSMDVSKFTLRKNKYWGDKKDEIMQEHAHGQQFVVNHEGNSGDYYPSPNDGGY